MFTFVETGLQDCALFCASSENIYSNGRLDILSNLAVAGLQLELLLLAGCMAVGFTEVKYDLCKN